VQDSPHSAVGGLLTMTTPDRPNTKPLPRVNGADVESVSFGNWLRTQREVRSITLREIADHTKITVRYLEALEGDDFEQLPGAVFTKGFLREYARYVGLEPDEVVNSYLNAQQPDGPVEDRSEPEPGGSAWTSTTLVVLVVVAILALIAVIAFWAKRRSEQQEAPPPIAAPPVEAVPQSREQPTIASESTPLSVTMEFTEDCWVEAIIDGDARVSELHVTGESLRLSAESEVLLNLANPSGVRIEVNGEPYVVAPTPEGDLPRQIEIRLEAPPTTEIQTQTP